MNQSTRFGYDNRDNLIAVTDPNGHTTRYAYDKADRKTREIRPGGQIIAYTYDLAGRLSSSTDPDGRRSESRYDAAGQLSQQQHFAAGADTAERGVSYSYDANGNLSGYSDGTLGASYEYDENNRKTRESTDYGPFSLSHRYSYDAAGHKKTYTGPDDTAISYHWVKGQLSRIELPGEGSLYYNHYRWSEPDTISWPGGSRRQISYTADLKPTRLLDQDPGENPVLDTRYAYDATGNITQRATQSATYDYSYDALQRLSEAKSDVETEGWDYDPNGNRTSDNLNPGEWRYDDNDRLLESPAITYTYDEAGNTVSKTKGSTTTHYRYNAEGRLRRIEDQAQTLIADYQYDPLGRRIKKTTQAGSQYYHYSDEGLAGEYDATGAPIRQYGYRPEGTWMSEPLYQKTAQGYAYYQTDHLGSPQGLISKTGARVWRASYRAFGELAQESGPWANPLRFPGQYYDQETGLHYNYFRTYDPSTGRYLESDPIGLDGGLNTYSYAFNNPLKYTDPTGEAAVLDDALIIGGGAALADGPLPIGDIIAGVIITGAIIYEACSDDDDDDEERCRKVKNQCIESCSQFGLPSKHGDGVSFRRCVRNCMERQGCFNF